jgi:hypothetical protein
VVCRYLRSVGYGPVPNLTHQRERERSFFDADTSWLCKA